MLAGAIFSMEHFKEGDDEKDVVPDSLIDSILSHKCCNVGSVVGIE
jgi:hypothetical protein